MKGGHRVVAAYEGRRDDQCGACEHRQTGWSRRQGFRVLSTKDRMNDLGLIRDKGEYETSMNCVRDETSHNRISSIC
jgi:hypothetical protein